MDKLMLVSLILSLLVIYSRFSPVYSGLLGLDSSSPEEKECLDSFNKVSNLGELKEFLKRLVIGFDNGYFTSKDLNKCLGSKNVHKASMKKFEVLIEDAEKGSICSMESIVRLGAVQEFLSSTYKENKKLRLTPWWEKFVRQTIIKCKSSFAQKLDSVSKDGFLFEGIVNLAQNFRWQDTTNFIKKKEHVFKISGDYFVGEDWRGADLAEKTSGRITELLDAEIDGNDMNKKQSKQPKYDVKLTETKFASLGRMFNKCNRIMYYKKQLFDPLVSLSKLGYDDSALKLDNSIANQKYIHAWLASIKMCMLLRHVSVLKLSNGTTRLKAGLKYKEDNMDEMGASLQRKLVIPPKNGVPEYQKETDGFSEFDDELVEKISGPSKEDDKMMRNNDKLSNINKNNIKTAVYSEEFLELIVDYLHATNTFEFH